MRVSYEQEKRLCERLLTSAGLPVEDARLLGEVVAHSDFTGVYSHGLSRFVNYVRRFMSGALDPRGEVRVVKDGGAVLSVDCGNSSGILAVNKVYDLLLGRAREHGIAFAAAFNSSNIGCGNYYGWRAAADGMIGLLCCNTVLSVAPYGGAEKLLGINPIIIAAPAGEERPLVLDMSTSVIAWGKIQAAQREKTPLQPGWALDREGRPTTDPEKAYSILPIAGHKGYGLAVMVDVLSALLSGACCGADAGKPGTPEKTGFTLALIDVGHFMPLEEFQAAVDKYIRSIKSSRKAEGSSGIFLPGEPEFLEKARRLETGYEISSALTAELASLAADLGLSPSGASLSQLLSD